MKIQGVVRGTSIALEEPIPALDGRRVSVVLEAVDADATDASPEADLAAPLAEVGAGKASILRGGGIGIRTPDA